MTVPSSQPSPRVGHSDPPKVPDSYRAFFDDAATFPPGRAPLGEAVTAYLERRHDPLAEGVGPSVLALAEVPNANEVAQQFDDGADPLPVSVVVPAGALDEARRIAGETTSSVGVVAYELKIAEDEGLAELVAHAGQAVADDGVAIWVELPAGRIEAESMRLLAVNGLGLKFRTGGLSRELFPSSEQLAGVIVAAVSAGVPFKLTAGLHEAIRFTAEETGFNHHGFLNIAAATAVAQAGSDVTEVVDLLDTVDSARVVAAANPGSWRDSFASFGTCSIIEPAESLQRLGLLDPALLATDSPHSSAERTSR